MSGDFRSYHRPCTHLPKSVFSAEKEIILYKKMVINVIKSIHI